MPLNTWTAGSPWVSKELGLYPDHEIFFASHGCPGALADEGFKEAFCALPRHKCQMQSELPLLRVLEAPWRGDEHPPDLANAG